MQEPGQELDSLVARVIFGLVVIIDTQAGTSYIMGHNREKREVPPYSTDTETADEIINLMDEHGLLLSMQNKKINGEACWVGNFGRDDGRRYVPSYATTLPALICQAGIDAIQGNNIYQGTKA